MNISHEKAVKNFSQANKKFQQEQKEKEASRPHETLAAMMEEIHRCSMSATCRGDPTIKLDKKLDNENNQRFYLETLRKSGFEPRIEHNKGGDCGNFSWDAYDALYVRNTWYS